MRIQSEQAFHRTALEHPNDPSVRLALADWLESRADPRGHLMQIQTQLLRINVSNRRGLEAEMQEVLRRGVEPVKVIVTNSIGMKMVLLPPGEFLMGTPDAEKEAAPVERPQQQVRISKGFLCSVLEISQYEYSQIVGDDWGGGINPDHPAYPLNWFDAIRFCNLLSEREKLSCFYQVDNEHVTACGGPGYRLPTEAEWEYACRAGTTTSYFFGNSRKELKEYAVYNHHWIPFFCRLSMQPCGSRRPNPWGLYDMLGNVCEWCYDWFSPFEENHNRYLVDPVGPAQGYARTVRGGSYLFHASENRCAFRFLGFPADKCHGFRIVRNYSG